MQGHDFEGRVLVGECSAPALKPAEYVFRDTKGRVVFHVAQSSRWGLAGYTKFRTLFHLELQWADPAGRPQAFLRRRGPWWKASWELLDAFRRELASLVPTSFLGTRWTLTDARTGEVAAGKLHNPLILGPQGATVSRLDGSPLAVLSWSGYSWRLGCHRDLRVELEDRAWELPALALGVIRWVGMQNR